MAAVDPNIPPVSGLVAGKYELVRLIGRGGMGSVWEGRHTSLGTRFAIKFIDSEYADSQEARQRFDNEARAAATIESKHAIRIFDHGVTEDGRPYIVMELLIGEPLDKRLERLGRLSLPETARILRHVSRALQRAHASGIIHRDLKPENIFIVRSQDDDEEVAKVLDFGIAKIRGPAMQQQGVSSSTKTGAVLGTPYYMSPEQARGLRNIDHRTDVWSLGVIAFKCVTGQLPFEGESVGDLLVKICTNPLPVPSQVQPGLPPSFDAWFQRALDREPVNRFETAGDLADALAVTCGLSVRRGPTSSGSETAFAGTPIGVLPVAATEPARPAVVLTPTPVPARPTPAGAMMAAHSTSAPFTAPSPGIPRSSSRWWILVAALLGLLGGAVVVVTAVSYARKSPSRATANGGTTSASVGAIPTAAISAHGSAATTANLAGPSSAIPSATALAAPTSEETTPSPAGAASVKKGATGVSKGTSPAVKPLPAAPTKPAVNRDEPGF